MASVKLSKFVEAMGFKNLTPDIDLTKIRLTVPDINRPALQLTGYFEHFDKERVQMVGYVEYTYLQNMPLERKIEIYRQYLSYEVPCTIFCSLASPDPEFLELAVQFGRPVFYTDQKTSSVMAKVIHWLSIELAPCIGKSEAALELIKRGHRLVTDDVVEIRRINETELIGTSPEITRHFIELRGIGIIDVKALFGVESVKESQSIDLVIKLEDWNKDKEYDRLGLEEEYTEFLGNKVVCHSLPIRPGRNLAIIVESAAVNHRQKKMGYNAAKELYKRVQESLAKRREADD